MPNALMPVASAFRPQVDKTTGDAKRPLAALCVDGPAPVQLTAQGRTKRARTSPGPMKEGLPWMDAGATAVSTPRSPSQVGLTPTGGFGAVIASVTRLPTL